MNTHILSADVSGTVNAISSKSYAHRMLIAASLCDEPLEVRINAFSEDIDATIDCLKAFGAHITKTNNGIFIEPLFKKGEKPTDVSFLDSRQCKKTLTIDCKESGSTARFLVPVAAFLHPDVTLIGSGRLPSRPFSSLCRELNNKGSSFNGEYIPLNIKTPNGLQSGTFNIEGNISSQYISALLFILPLLDGDSRINLTSKLESASYIDMTIEVLSLFGIVIQKSENAFIIPGNQRYRAPYNGCAAEGDWSNGAFFLAMGALGKSVTVNGLKTNSTQGDRAILSLLKQFGAQVTEEEHSITIKGLGEKHPLQGIEIDASQIPDLVPCLAVVASVSEGKTRIYNAARLRLKESDRLKTTTTMLSNLGAHIHEQGDELIIEGKKVLDGGTVNGENDHRIVMAAALASLVCKNPVSIIGSNAVQKSYPGFFADFNSIGGLSKSDTTDTTAKGEA